MELKPCPFCGSSPKWISVKDRLPDKLEKVLIYVPCNKSQYVASRCDWETCNDWHIANDISFEPLEVTFENVTHWQPLPEPPHG